MKMNNHITQEIIAQNNKTELIEIFSNKNFKLNEKDISLVKRIIKEVQNFSFDFNQLKTIAEYSECFDDFFFLYVYFFRKPQDADEWRRLGNVAVAKPVSKNFKEILELLEIEFNNAIISK